MTNVELGLVLKAMYKYSGMTVGTLSEKTGITVDTINNLFYGRVQKPGLFGVVSLVETMGFRTEELLSILREQPVKELPQNTLVEILTAYTEKRTEGTASAPVAVVVRTAAGQQTAAEDAGPVVTLKTLEAQRKELNEEHERSLDRFKATHAHYCDELKQQYKESLEQIRADHEETVRKLEDELDAVRKNSEQEIGMLRRKNKHLVWALIAETALMVGAFMADLFNHQIGWFRRS